MEESEKRRERLKAMRMEAAQGDGINGATNFTESHGLSNPFIETSSMHQQTCAPQRFDYYTDPMSAYSGNKRSKVSQNISQEHFTAPRPQNTVMTPPPALPAELGSNQPQIPGWSPVAMTRPSLMQPGTPRGINGPGHTPAYYYPSNSPRGGSCPSPASPGFVQEGGPIYNSGQGRGHWYSNSPGTNLVHGGTTPGFGQEGGASFNSEHGRGSNKYLIPGSDYGGNPGFGQEGRLSYNSGQGRAYMSTNSPRPSSAHGGSSSLPSYNSGQGREYLSSNSPRPGSGYGGNPGFGHGGRQSYNSGQGRGYRSDNSPRPGSGRGGRSSFGQEGRSSLNSGQSRGNWSRNSPNPYSGYGNTPGPNSGRGGGRWLGNNSSPGLRWNGGRGRGRRGREPRDNVSAEDRPDLYYNKLMVEDPWKFLEPVIWKMIYFRPNTQKSWMPNSISMKSAKASEIGSSASKSDGPSLSEYLAASFNDVVGNEDINEESSA